MRHHRPVALAATTTANPRQVPCASIASTRPRHAAQRLRLGPRAAEKHDLGSVGGVGARARRRASNDGDADLAQLLLLGSTSSTLQTLWDQELRPEFDKQDAALRERCAATASAAPPSPSPAAAVALVAAAERTFLALRRASALASHLSKTEQQRDQQQQAAALAVLAETRARAEELLARDALLAAAEAALRALPPPPPSPPTNTPVHHNHHRALQLVRRLRRDGWQPRRATEAAPALAAEAQRGVQSDLSASARACCAAAALELTSDALAPRVEADAEGITEVLGPLGLDFGQAAAAGGGSDSAPTPTPGELVLTLSLAEAVLQRHPREDVREAVADAAMAPRTDALLRAWQAAGDARRRLARARGEPSHAASLALGVDGLMPVRKGSTEGWEAPWGFEVEVEDGEEHDDDEPSPAVSFLAALERRLRRLEKDEEAPPPSPPPPPPLDALFDSSSQSTTSLLDRALSGVGEVVEAAFGLRLVVGGEQGGEGADAAAATAPRRRILPLHVHDSNDNRQLGTVLVDPTGGYGTRQLLFGDWCPGGQDDQEEEEEQRAAASAPPPPPTASVGLQAGASLLASSPSQLLASLPPGADPWQAVADALAELAHELGHALHFVLSSSAAAAAAERQQQRQRQQERQAPAVALPPAWPVAAAAMEQPLWLLELPSTLLELLCADERAIARMLLPSSSAAAANTNAARTLAARQARRRDPRALCALVALMRADEAVTRWSGPRAPTVADAARAWAGSNTDDGSGRALPPLLTPDQARAAPRVLSAQGQAYGYLVAWCLASAVVGEMVLGVEGEGGGDDAAAAPGPWIRAAAGRAVRINLFEVGSGLPAAVTARELVGQVLKEARGGGGGEEEGLAPPPRVVALSRASAASSAPFAVRAAFRS